MSIFEKIGEKLSGAGQGVAQQVKNFADVARLNSIISEKEKQIAQLYIEIGQAYYEHHKIDPQGEEIERIQKISSLNAEILECKENIKQIKGVTKCPNCGADVSLDAAFCNACGTKIPPAAKVEDISSNESGALCPNCWQRILQPLRNENRTTITNNIEKRGSKYVLWKMWSAKSGKCDLLQRVWGTA